MGEGVVSIPVGFFQALQHKDALGSIHEALEVSIPVGFFQALQPPDEVDLAKTIS